MTMIRSRVRRWIVGRLAVALVVATAAAFVTPRPAEAFHGHHGFHHGGWHGGFGFGHVRHGGWGFGHGAYAPWGHGGLGWGGGWGVPCWPMIGNVSYGTGFAVGGTRFWSGTTVFGVPAWGGCGPVWGGGWGAPVWSGPVWGGGWGAPVWSGPVWGGGWGGGWGGPRFGGVGAWYGGWNPGPGWGWNRGPARGWAIPFASATPAFPRPGFRAPFAPPQPFGAPAFGLAAIQGPRATTGSLTSRPTAPGEAFAGRGQLGAPTIDPAVEVTIRTSNAPARARSARLVASGDRHLREAIDDPARLAKAIDAYRRAATIAPDQPDTFLRQAIALTAAGKPSAAATALGRAVAIDPRLAEGSAEARGPIPAAPALLAAKPLATRSGKLLARIFATPEGDRSAPADNWIARRWQGREAEPTLVAARR